MTTLNKAAVERVFGPITSFSSENLEGSDHYYTIIGSGYTVYISSFAKIKYEEEIYVGTLFIDRLSILDHKSFQKSDLSRLLDILFMNLPASSLTPPIQRIQAIKEAKSTIASMGWEELQDMQNYIEATLLEKKELYNLAIT